jgi:hypothetical protein
MRCRALAGELLMVSIHGECRRGHASEGQRERLQ